MRASAHEQQAALADASYERGGRLTDDERDALRRWSLWRRDSYPIRRVGRKWTLDHRAAAGAGLYRTKRDAVRAWEILIAEWIRLSQEGQ